MRLLLAIGLMMGVVDGFSSGQWGCVRSSGMVMYGTNRRSRRNQKKQTQQSRPKSFYDAMEDAEGKEEKPKPKKEEPEVMSSEQTANAQPDTRPEVSRIVVDEETGIERIQQGEKVMDVLTRKAVQLSDLGPEYRMAQMFPGVPPETREQLRLPNPESFTVDQMIATLETVLLEDDGGVSGNTSPKNNVALDFVLANRDLLGGWKMLKTLGRMKLKAQSEGNKERALYLRQLWKRLWTLEDSLNAPFRQMVLDAEARVGPNFGNLDLKSFANGHLYERTSNYLVLKGMVAHWEKKVNDAQFVETANQPPNGPTDVDFLELLMVGDPKRYLPDPPIIFRYNECVRIALMAQNMTAQFVSVPELYDDLPPEIRFVEDASFIKGGTALREYMVNTFCPNEGITPAALREGLKRLEVQMSNLQIDPYGDLRNVISRLSDAVCVGTGPEGEHDPYLEYLVGSIRPNSPGHFQTYTMDHDRQSMVRFLDSAKTIQQGTIGPTDNLANQLSREASNLFGFGAAAPEKQTVQTNGKAPYKTPDPRASGRPHNLGWLELLGDEEMTGGSLDAKPSENGKDDIFESDNWREVITKRQNTGASN